MTTGSNISLWTAGQSQPDVTVNEALNILDAFWRTLTHNMASDADYTLDTATGSAPFEWQYGVINITDTGVVLTTGRNIIVPTGANFAKTYFFVNNTAQTLTVKTAAGTGIAVATNKHRLVEQDGVNVVSVSPADF